MGKVHVKALHALVTKGILSLLQERVEIRLGIDTAAAGGVQETQAYPWRRPAFAVARCDGCSQPHQRNLNKNGGR